MAVHVIMPYVLCNYDLAPRNYENKLSQHYEICFLKPAKHVVILLLHKDVTVSFSFLISVHNIQS